MYSITGPAFALSEILAMQLSGTLQNGANKPLIIRGINLATQLMGDFVLKYRGAERIDEAACGRELLASFLATELEIHVPLPVIVHVGDHFLNTLKSHPDYQKICKGKGINFGCTYLAGNIDIEQHQVYSPNQQQQAARIFLFDLLIQNADRRRGKPNMFIVKENIYVIDHELPYGFLATLPFLSSTNPWELNDTDVNAAKNHFFYPLLHKNQKRIDWDEAAIPFLNIGETFWQLAKDFIPQNWMNAQDFEKTETHFTRVQANFETFKSEIWNKILMA